MRGRRKTRLGFIPTAAASRIATLALSTVSDHCTVWRCPRCGPKPHRPIGSQGAPRDPPHYPPRFSTTCQPPRVSPDPLDRPSGPDSQEEDDADPQPEYASGSDDDRDLNEQAKVVARRERERLRLMREQRQQLFQQASSAAGTGVTAAAEAKGRSESRLAFLLKQASWAWWRGAWRSAFGLKFCPLLPRLRRPQ